MEKFEKTAINLKTLDGKNIAAMLYSPKSLEETAISGGVVFTHMMPAAKESWEFLAINLAEKGYLGLAIDLRGHGESEGGPKAYTKLDDAEHQKSILDLDAAAKFLMGKGFTAGQIIFIGASIGANLSLKYIVDNQDFKTVILLSPGLNYRGTEAEASAASLSPGQRIFIISARDDGGNAAEAKTIFAAIKDGIEKRLEIFETGGHGTHLLENKKKLQEMIEEFFAPVS